MRPPVRGVSGPCLILKARPKTRKGTLHTLTVHEPAATLKPMRVLLTVALLAACTPRHGPHGPSLPSVGPAEGWSLTVVNRHWLDISIVVMSDDQRSHLGTVSATQTQTYELPARMIATGRLIRLEANPIGATRILRTDPLLVQSGQRVEWTLETGLERSTVAVW